MVEATSEYHDGGSRVVFVYLCLSCFVLNGLRESCFQMLITAVGLSTILWLKSRVLQGRSTFSRDEVSCRVLHGRRGTVDGSQVFII